MPIIYQGWIARADLQRNPKALYVFGDNVQRQGMGGQAGAMRGEPNAVGVATKYLPTMEDEAFFTDEKLSEQKEILTKDLRPIIKHLKKGGVVIWPLDGIGNGLSEVPARAPKTWAFMESVRYKLEKL